MKKPKLPVRSNKKETVKSKKKYRIKNWSKYNESLVHRGSLDFWIEKGIIDSWEIHIVDENKKKKRGAQIMYSDKAIETCKLIGKIYHQRLRQTEGFVESIFTLSNVSLAVPDFSTLCRRGVNLEVTLPKNPKEKVVAIIDSTGVKVYGEGEWKVRQHGYSKRRTWMKIHVSIDKDGEIRAMKLTGNNIDDARASADLLEQQKTETIDSFIGDGAYDKRKVYEECKKQHIRQMVIPPSLGAKIWRHGNKKGEKHPRDENLRAIRKSSRKKWKEVSHYHVRSLVENTMFRTKTIFGDRLFSRSTKQQEVEVALMGKALNMMLYAGIPESYAVT